jgi:endonuclease III
MTKIQRVFEIFEKNYKAVPLEIFAGDPYRILISTILSARTNDDVTLPAAQRLFAKAPDIQHLARLRELEISNLIYPVGFYKTKAKHLKKTAEIIVQKFASRVPATREELMLLPGVGRKTANLVLNRAFGLPAIAVDTHVHKITNLLGWVKTKSPEETERALSKKLPKKYWSEINRLFVSIGRQFRTKKKLTEFLEEQNLLS